MPRKVKRKAKRNPKLQTKYILRRGLLSLLLLALVGGCGWFFGRGGFKPSHPEDFASQESTALPDEPTADAPEAPAQVNLPEDSSGSPPESGQDTKASADESADWSLLLVDESHPLPKGYQVHTELIGEGCRVNAKVAGMAVEMLNQARLDGIVLIPVNAYRDGGWEGEMACAQEHATGLALDLTTPALEGLSMAFADTPAYGWLSENAGAYGFVLRYPENRDSATGVSFQPWHFRYVGAGHAAFMTANNLALEEYLVVLERGIILEAEAAEEDDGGEEAE